MSGHDIDPDALLENSQGASNSVIGYQAGDSFLHRLNPVTKLVLTAGITVIAFVLPGYRGPLALLAGVVVVVVAAGVGRDVLRAGAVIGTPLALILLIVQGFFYPRNEIPLVAVGGVPFIGTVTLWREGVLFALGVVFQLLVAIVAMLTTIATSHPRKLTVALIEKGMPRKLAYVFMSALQFVPRIRGRSQDIVDAQQARGLDTRGSVRRRMRALVDLLSPLLISELIAAQTRGLALEARGFNRSDPQTIIYTIPDGTVDRILRWGTLVAVVVVVIGVIVGWR